MKDQTKIDEAIKRGWIFDKELSSSNKSYFKNQERTFLVEWDWNFPKAKKWLLNSKGEVTKCEENVLANLWEGSYSL